MAIVAAEGKHYKCDVVVVDENLNRNVVVSMEEK